jgi:glycosidase
LVEASKKWLNSGLRGYVIRASENNDFYEFWEKEINPEKKFLIKFDFTDNRSDKKTDQITYQLPQFLYGFLAENTIKFTGEDLYTNLYILNGNKENINFIEGLDIDRLNSAIINVNRELDSDNEENNNYLGINPLMIDSNNLSKYKLGILIQFLLKGSPSIYYGSEKYMWGGDVPHNRKAMIWDEYFPYMDESDNLSKYESRKASLDTKIMFDQVEGIVKYKIPLEKSLEDFYKKLIKFRQENENIINNGFMDKIKTSDNLLVFSKTFRDETLIFAINKSNKEEKVVVEVGKGKKLIDLFENNHKDILKSKAEIVVPPMGFVIYKKEK